MMEELDGFVDSRHSLSEGWQVRELSQAAWAMRKIRRAQERIAEVQATASLEIAQFEAWRDKRVSEEQATIDFFTSALAPYVSEQIADGKKKSLLLPDGVAGYRARPAEFRRDDAALKPWAEKLGLVRTTTEVDWQAVKATCRMAGSRLVSPDGEFVPGVTVEERSPAFYVRLNEDEGER